MVSAHLSISTPTDSDLIAGVDGVMGGRPVIRGTRITVASVKGRVSGGESLDDLMMDYPEVAREAFEAAVAYDDGAGEGCSTLDGLRRKM